MKMNNITDLSEHHGFYKNKSDRLKRAFVVNIFAEGAKSDTNEVVLDGVTVIKGGQKMEG